MLFSDGLFEQVNDESIPYGIERIQKILLQHHAKNAQEIKENVIQDFKEFLGGEIKNNDDLSFIIIKKR